MDIRAVTDEASYDWAIREIGVYFDHEPARGTPEADRFDILATLIEAYEAKHYPIGLPHPIEAIKIRMQDKSITQRQLATATGIAESNLSQALSLRRALSLTMIRSIGPVLDLPLEVLVQPYSVSEREHA